MSQPAAIDPGKDVADAFMEMAVDSLQQGNTQAFQEVEEALKTLQNLDPDSPPTVQPLSRHREMRVLYRGDNSKPVFQPKGRLGFVVRKKFLEGPLAGQPLFRRLPQREHLPHMELREHPNGMQYYDYPKGGLTCYLHPDNPERAKFLALGVRTLCYKASMNTIPDVEVHLEVCHPDTYQRRETAKDRDRADRQLQAQIEQTEVLRQMMANGQTPPGNVEVIEKAWRQKAKKPTAKIECPACGKKVKPMGLAMHRTRYCKKGEA